MERDPEDLSTPLDKATGLARESRSAAWRGSPLWHATPAHEFEEAMDLVSTGKGPIDGTFPVREGEQPRDIRRRTRNLSGIFPQGFLSWALRLLGNPQVCLHICSGAVPRGPGAVRVDIRAAMEPDVVADGRRLPFGSDTFEAALLDPPYSIEYAEVLYGVDYPRPSHLLAEAARVTRPQGRIGILHFLVPGNPPGTRRLGVWGVTTGVGYRIRAYTVFEREQRGLF